jgi:hypothetical protein
MCLHPELFSKYLAEALVKKKSPDFYIDTKAKKSRENMDCSRTSRADSIRRGR